MFKEIPVFAEHAFPPTQAVYTPRAESHGVETHSSFCLKPSRGSGVAFGSRAPYGAGRLRRRPRFARLGLASLGLVGLRKEVCSERIQEAPRASEKLREVLRGSEML